MYLDVEWTRVRLNKKNMDITLRTDGFREWEDIRVPDEVWVWLNTYTGIVQSNLITESNWWWDRKADDEDHIYFFFRDPDTALQFKLTWS
jgi:hypothetical protein